MYRPNLTLEEAVTMIGQTFHIPHVVTGHEVEHREMDGKHWTAHVYPKQPSTKRMLITGVHVSKYSDKKIVFEICDADKEFNHRMHVGVDELYEDGGSAQHKAEHLCSKALEPETRD